MSHTTSVLEILRRIGLRLGWGGAANLIGLASAFVIAILFAGLVKVELDYDRALDPQGRVFLIGTRIQIPGQPMIANPGATVDLAASLRAQIPGTQVGRLALEDVEMPLQIDGESRTERVYAADASLAQILSFETVSGNAKAALTTPDGIVLTRSAARRLFGSFEVIGRFIRIDTDRIYQVRAVIDDFPRNTQLANHQIFIAGSGSRSLAASAAADASLMVVGGAHTYVRIPKEGYPTIAEAGRALEQAANQHMRATQQRFSAKNRAAMQLKMQLRHQAVPLRELHWIDGFKLRDEQVNRGDPARLWALAALAALALLVAMLNFVNLSITQVTRRAREIALNKAFGGSRRRIALAALAENIAVVVLSGLLAFAIAVALQDWFASFVDRDIDIGPWPLAIAAVVTGAVIVGLAAGSYPALVLSRIRPAVVLSAREATAPGVGLLRTTLVVVQVIASVFASGLAIVIALQLDHVTGRTLRFHPDGVVVYQLPDMLETRLRAMTRELHSSAAIAQAATAGATIAGGQFASTTMFREGGEPVELRTFRVSPGYFEALGIPPVAGRVFLARDEHPGSTSSQVAAPRPLVLTETATKRLGFPSAQAGIGRQVRLGVQQAGTGVIVGVVPDFPVNDVRDPAARVAAFQAGTQAGDTLIVRLAAGIDEQVLEGVERQLTTLSGGKTPNRIVLSDRIAAAFRDLSRLLALVTLMAVVSVVAATLGLIGLSIIAVQRMRREVAIRKVYGASARDIAALMFARLGLPLGVGLVTGLLVAWAGANRFLATFPDRTPDAVLAVIIAAVALAGLSFIVIAVGVWSLVRTRPALALRYE